MQQHGNVNIADSSPRTLDKTVLSSWVVDPGTLCLWSLGQSGFVFKSPAGALFAIDPYLSDYCGVKGEADGLDCRRKLPAALDIDDLFALDYWIVTHSHEDHLDPTSLEQFVASGGTGPFIAPMEAADRIAAAGIGESRIERIWPNKVVAWKDVWVRATFAIPYAADDLNHVGYLIGVNGGPTIYMTGDTDYNEILGTVAAAYRPELMLTVINGAFRNLSPSDAARLARDVGADAVAPYHHDLFTDGGMDPNVFRLNLRMYGMDDRFMLLEYATPTVVRRRGSSPANGAANA